MAASQLKPGGRTCQYFHCAVKINTSLRETDIVALAKPLDGDYKEVAEKKKLRCRFGFYRYPIAPHASAGRRAIGGILILTRFLEAAIYAESSTTWNEISEINPGAEGFGNLIYLDHPNDMCRDLVASWNLPAHLRLLEFMHTNEGREYRETIASSTDDFTKIYRHTVKIIRGAFPLRRGMVENDPKSCTWDVLNAWIDWMKNAKARMKDNLLSPPPSKEIWITIRQASQDTVGLSR